MAQFDFGPNIFAPAEQSFEDWLKYSLGRDTATQAAGVAGMGQGISQFATQQQGMATQAANRAREEALRAKTMQAWEEPGPQQEQAPDDVYDPRNVTARARLAATEMSSDRALMEAQKRAATSASEAMAEQRTAQTQKLKALQDSEERLKNAQAALAEEQAKNAPDVAKLRQTMTNFRMAQMDREYALRAAGEERRSVTAERDWFKAQNPGAFSPGAIGREEKQAPIRDALSNLKATFKPEFVGLIDQPLGTIERTLGISSPQYNTFRAAHEQVRQFVANELYAGNLTPQEARRFDNMFSGTMGEGAYQAGLDELLKRYGTMSGVRTGGVSVEIPLTLKRPGFASPGASPVAPGAGAGGKADHGAVVRTYKSGGRTITVYADGWWE